VTDQPPSLRDQIAEALMSWAERNVSPQYASLRRPDTVRQNAYGRADAVLAVLDAARQTTEQPTCACGHPKDRHLTCCTECPCIWYAPTWPPTASGQQPETTCHPAWFAGECPCPTGCGCCKVAAVEEPDPTTADDPTPLRWGLGDVLHGDDDTVIVCLSGPDREPYWLELDPERAAALRDDLAGPAVGQPAEAQAADEARVRWCVESSYPNGGTVLLPGVDDRGIADSYLNAARESSPEATHRLVRETTTWTVEDETR
jgi:hypothetical protein